MVGFDVKNLGFYNNAIVNPCHPWLIGEFITESQGKHNSHQLVLKYHSFNRYFIDIL